MDWVFVAALPALGLLIVWLVFARWGKRRDPMKPTHFDHLGPGAANRSRSSFDD